jgi:Mg-chelatase subunit ChlD
MQLPKGLELKAVTSPDGTTCDSHQFPLVTCQLPDLSIASPTQTSQTEVNVDVTLKDAGLLVLMNEAKVTASNYPTHTVRERTNIFIPDHIKIDLVMVIDTTNSMAPEINGVKAAIDKLIATVPAGQRPTMALVEFKDDVRVKAFTQDTEVMLGAVAKLVAEGGGTCPEASVEALEVALKHLRDGGTILLATDASPYPEANLEDLVKRIKSGNMTFDTIISGDCTGEGDVNEMTK